jgi:hypothetical protein
VLLQGPAGVAKVLNFWTGNSPRWNIQADSSAESGGNVGSTLVFSRFSDAGTFIDNPLSISRFDGSLNLPAVLNRYMIQSYGTYYNGTFDGTSWLKCPSPRGTMTLSTVDLPAAWHGWRMSVDAQVFDFQSTGQGYAQVSWLTYSDRRLKESLEPIKDALAKVADLTGYTFERNDAKELDGTPRKQAGLIAQDVLPVLPQAVSEAHDGDMNPVMALDYNAIVALLVNAVKELTVRVAALETA